MIRKEIDWVKSAMTDDSVVAELLLLLKHTAPPRNLAVPFNWTLRRRRSNPSLTTKSFTTIKASPTTPLSLSGATATSLSGSGGIDGVEETRSLHPKSSDANRSKVTGNSKRPRKKTLAELKELEMLLLKERRHLQKGLADLYISLEQKRATNERLKRMKLDVQIQEANERVQTSSSKESIPELANQNSAAAPIKGDEFDASLKLDVRIQSTDERVKNGSSEALIPEQTNQNSINNDDFGASRKVTPSNTSLIIMQKELEERELKFVIPDLNFPLQED